MMREAPRGLAIVAWANGIVGLIGVSRCLPALGLHEVPRPFLLAVALRAVLQVVAGQRLLAKRDWARRYLLLCAAATLVVTAPSLIKILMVLPQRGAKAAAGYWLISTTAIPILTLWYLSRAEVRESFPPLPRGERIAVDACAALVLLWV